MRRCMDASSGSVRYRLQARGVGLNVAGRPIPDGRASVHGKFLTAGGQKFYVCGVTYGPFRPDE